MDELEQLIAHLVGSAWTSTVVWFGSLWAILLFIRKVFKDADNDLDPEKRRLLSENLAKKNEWASGSWIPDFTGVFDRFFGIKHLTWRCFYRSALISIASYSLLFAIVISLNVEILSYDVAEPIWVRIVGVLAWAVLFNVIPDYLSLLETRVLLSARLPIPIIIVIDFVLTFLIVITWMLIIAPGPDLDYARTTPMILESLLGNRDESIETYSMYIVISTSFTTSIWLWLHGLSRLTIRGLSAAETVMNWLNVKENPLRAIGTTINVFVLLIGIVLFPLVLIIG